MYKGIIFDFNGTLFNDTDLQEGAWDVVMRKYLGRGLGPTEFRDSFHGLGNEDIVPYLNRQGPAEPLTIAVTDEKEEIYRQICRENPDRAKLVPGAEELFVRLKAEGVPMAIATASEIRNVTFFIEFFGLERWFPRDHIIYDDRTFPCKPAPDIYLKAADRLGLNIADCMVCEDSVNGILAAKSAGAGRIFALNPQLAAEKIRKDPKVYAVIDDFTDFYQKYFLEEA